MKQKFVYCTCIVREKKVQNMLIMRFFDESSIIKGAVGRPRLTEKRLEKTHEQ